jgi:tetratricopeptide (TPR) repeat protein
MKHTRLFACLFTMALVLGACATGPLKYSRVQALYGMIYDRNNRPVGNVSIYINEKYAASSDIHGRFSVPQLKPKLTYAVSAKKEAYEEARLDISYSDPAQVLYIQMLSADDLLAEAEEALGEKDWLKAESSLSRALNTGANPLALGYLRGILAFGRGRYREALDILLNLAEEEKDAPFLYLFIADLYQYRFDDADRAGEFLRKFLELREDGTVRSRLEMLRENT